MDLKKELNQYSQIMTYTEHDEYIHVELSKKSNSPINVSSIVALSLIVQYVGNTYSVYRLLETDHVVSIIVVSPSATSDILSHLSTLVSKLNKESVFSIVDL